MRSGAVENVVGELEQAVLEAGAGREHRMLPLARVANRRERAGTALVGAARRDPVAVPAGEDRLGVLRGHGVGADPLRLDGNAQGCRGVLDGGNGGLVRHGIGVVVPDNGDSDRCGHGEPSFYFETIMTASCDEASEQ
jgi:hypothetical protein